MDFLVQSHSMAGYVNAFLGELDVVVKSRKTYQQALNRFILWCDESGIDDSAGRETILAYKQYLQGQNIVASTLSLYMVAVRRLFQWTETKKLCPNIAAGIKGAKSVKGFRKDTLSISQVRELLASIDKTTLMGKRNFAMINLLVRTGLRTIEVTRANLGDIRQEGGEAVLYIQGKGRDTKDAFVVLTDNVLKPIREYLNARQDLKDDSPLFTSLSDRNYGKRLTTISVSRLVKSHLRGIGLDDKRLTAHSLRHTAITLSLKGGASIQEAKELARHSDINTTLIYSHNINRIAHAPERRIDALLESEAT